jgi:uncharacterized membrane protein
VAAIGFERTMVQDVPFGLRRLVDIGSKVLSPAVNDPSTSVQAVQHLSVLVCMLGGGDLAPSRRAGGRCASPSPSRLALDKAP